MQPAADRSSIEGIVPPHRAACSEAWLRELVCQVLCLRAEMTGRPVAAIACEVLPGAQSISEDDPHAHAIRTLQGV